MIQIMLKVRVRAIGPGAILIVDSDHVSRAQTTQAIQVRLARISREVTGRELSANVVELGILAGLTGTVTRGSLESAASVRAPKGTSEVNLKALRAGFAAGCSTFQRSPPLVD